VILDDLKMIRRVLERFFWRSKNLLKRWGGDSRTKEKRGSNGLTINTFGVSSAGQVVKWVSQAAT
jgi:hypothetical protein